MVVAAQANTQKDFKGPVNMPYSAEDVLVDGTVWSPCGQPLPLNINSQVRIVRNGNASVSAAGTLYDGGLFDIGLKWQTCGYSVM